MNGDDIVQLCEEQIELYDKALICCAGQDKILEALKKVEEKHNIDIIPDLCEVLSQDEHIEFRAQQRLMAWKQGE